MKKEKNLSGDLTEDTAVDSEISLWEIRETVKANQKIIDANIPGARAAVLYAQHLNEIISKLRAISGDPLEVVLDHLTKTKFNPEQTLDYYAQHGRYPDEDRL